MEEIPKHISTKSGFDSFAEYTQALQAGSVRLAATRDIQPGEEIYTRHGPGDIQWECFHPAACNSSMYSVLYLGRVYAIHGGALKFIVFVLCR